MPDEDNASEKLRNFLCQYLQDRSYLPIENRWWCPVDQWTQVSRIPAALLVPIAQMFSSIDRANNLNWCVLSLMDIASFLLLVIADKFRLANFTSSKKKTMRPTHTQGVEPCAANPVSLNSLYLGFTYIILSYRQASVNSRAILSLTHHFRREFEHAIPITFDSYWTTRPIPVTPYSRMRSLNAFTLFCQRVH